MKKFLKFLRVWAAWILFSIAAWGIIGHSIGISLMIAGLGRETGIPNWEYFTFLLIYALCLAGWWKLK